jgi:multicomponent K+:H+ antiporter subunit F
MILTLALKIAATLLVLAILLNLWRLLRGPTMTDRILALDTLFVNSLGLLMLMNIAQDTALYFEAALLIAMLGFLGTVVLCKFLLRGDIIE